MPQPVAAVAVLTHGLGFLPETYVLYSPRCHALEKQYGTFPAPCRHPEHRCAVDFHSNPWLLPPVVRLKQDLQGGTGKPQLQAGTGPEQGKNALFLGPLGVEAA